MSSLLSDIPYMGTSSMPPSSVSPVSEGLQYFIDYINVLEGVKTRIKNMHWAAKRIPNSDKRGAHLYLDDLLSIISDFQDTVAESSQGIYGSMNLDSVSSVGFSASTPKELVAYIQNKTNDFYEGLSQTTVLAGIRSETEVIIKDLEKYQYLFSLTE